MKGTQGRTGPDRGRGHNDQEGGDSCAERDDGALRKLNTHISRTIVTYAQ